ncbi:DUF934 domain-containing protein [Leeia sp.]|uniref:DUF934 domain-containing protein n=1 Tax=Leeia sp. TaxID=2884678 RepID=UPI0035B25825
MPKLIKQGQLVEDHWQLAAADETATGYDSPVLVPLSAWLSQREHWLAYAHPVGLLVDGDAEPDEFAADLPHFSLIAIHFPAFTDGRGYSLARLLRERHHYHGELRATGDILRDQLQYLSRCGFDSFQLREGEDPAKALAGLADFSEHYQSALDQPLPLFRRRA